MGHSLCVACVPGQRAAARGAAHGPGVRAARGVGGAGAGARAAQEAGPPVGHGAGARPGRARRGERAAGRPGQEAAAEPARGHGAAGAAGGARGWREGWADTTRPREEEAGRAGWGGAGGRAGGDSPKPQPCSGVRAPPAAVGLVKPLNNLRSKRRYQPHFAGRESVAQRGKSRPVPHGDLVRRTVHPRVWGWGPPPRSRGRAGLRAAGASCWPGPCARGGGKRMS